jgi:hypothetical protein
MDNLQEAYTSYQQALYHLRDPKVSACSLVACDAQYLTFNAIGTQVVVWNWYPLRSLRLS